MKALLASISLLFPTFLGAETPVIAQPSNFIRIHHEPTEIHLQTSITTYQRDETSVSLLGAIHIADREYYQELNKRFRDYEVLLFELVGGETSHKFLDGKPKAARKGGEERPVQGLRGLYQSFANSMQLAQQIDLIDYTPKNFLHADFTMAEYAAATQGDSTDLFAFALESAVEQSKLTGEPFGGMNPALILQAMLSGDGSVLKKEFMKNMESGDEAAAQLTGGNLIIEERNLKCFRILLEQIKAGKTSLGIFYGAAHNPDLEKRLLKEGFRKTHEDWITAWRVPAN